MKLKTLLSSAAYVGIMLLPHASSVSPQLVHGTSAIAIWTPEKVVFAVDSKLRYLDGSVASGKGACKIRKIGKFSVVMSGLNNNPYTGYDTWELARTALTATTTVPEAASRMEQTIRPKLEKALLDVKKKDPVLFKDRFSYNYLAFMVAGVDSGSLGMAGRKFIPGRNSFFEVLPAEFPSKSQTAFLIGYVFLGEHKAIDAHYPDKESKDRLLISQDITKSATQLLQLEIDEDSATVGPPRAILEITKLGDKWIERGNCK